MDKLVLLSERSLLIEQRDELRKELKDAWDVIIGINGVSVHGGELIEGETLAEKMESAITTFNKICNEYAGATMEARRWAKRMKGERDAALADVERARKWGWRQVDLGNELRRAEPFTDRDRAIEEYMSPIQEPHTDESSGCGCVTNRPCAVHGVGIVDTWENVDTPYTGDDPIYDESYAEAMELKKVLP